MAPPGNAKLRGARQSMNIRSQAELAKAVESKARELGLQVTVTERTVRRWESATPPWPDADRAQALEALLQRPLIDLGFTPPWEHVPAAATTPGRRPAPHPQPTTLAAPIPAAAAAHYLAATVAYRQMYWSLPPTDLHRAVNEHARLGTSILDQVTNDTARIQLARATSEAHLLSGRLECFDLNQPDAAHQNFIAALQAAHYAPDSLLGAAALAHMAFPPAFSGDQARGDEARDHLRAARTFARRGDASPTILAWLDAVEAEINTRFGDTDRALALLHNAEQLLIAPTDPTTPETPTWFDWFSAQRLAGFAGNTLMAAGRGRQAHDALTAALTDLPDEAIKQRSVILADLAAAAVIENDPNQACSYLTAALDQLSRSWYATGMTRVKDVRDTLRPWDDLPAVRKLDERLYNWNTTVASRRDS